MQINHLRQSSCLIMAKHLNAYKFNKTNQLKPYNYPYINSSYTGLLVNK
jgi:hypothetical protein